MNLDTWTIDEPLYSSLMALTDLVLKGMLILLGARIITLLMSKTTAAARHVVWTVALVMMLLLPALNLFMPQLHLSILQHPLQTTAEAGPATTPVTSRQFARATGPRRPAAGATDAASQAQHSSTASSPVVASTMGDRNVGFLASYVGLMRAAHWTSLVMIIWALGAAVMLVWTFIGLTGAWWITRYAYPAEGESWEDLVEELSDRLMVYRPVNLRMSSSITSPMTWGVWRPVVLLPVDADDWSEERRRYVLMHELAHVKRWDTLTQFTAQLGCAFHWFNPLAWRSLYRMRMEQEKACDDLVLSHGMKASAYASHLLDIARSLKMPWTSPLNTISMAKPSQLEGRVVDILDPQKKQRTLNRFNVAMTCLIALAVLLPVAALSPWTVRDEAVAETLPEKVSSLRASVAQVGDVDRVDSVWAGNRFTTGGATQSVSSSDIAVWPERTDRHFNGKQSEDIAFLEPGIYSLRTDTTEEQRRARKKALNALRESLGDESAEVRRYAVMTLGEMGDRHSIGMITELLHTDPNAEVRKYAVIALDEIGSPASLPAYRVALQDQNAEVRRHAVYALAEQDEEEALAMLFEVLDDRDPDIRRAAMIGLAENGDDRVDPLLIKMLEDEDPDIRRHAIMAVGDREIQAALPMLERATRDANPEIRRLAILSISEYNDANATLILRHAIKDGNTEVRRAALMGLADRSDAESLPVFIDLLLNDRDAEVRKFAAMALGEIGDIEATDALTMALKDSDPEVRRHAAMALSDLDYGDDGDDVSWGNASGFDDNNWEGAGADGWEEFGVAMSQLGIAAGRIGIEAGAFSLGITGEILGELAQGLEGVELEADLAEAAAAMYEAELYQEELNHALEEARISMQAEFAWDESMDVLRSELAALNENALENNGQLRELLESIHQLEEAYGSPNFCQKLLSNLKSKNTRDARKALENISCSND